MHKKVAQMCWEFFRNFEFMLSIPDDEDNLSLSMIEKIPGSTKRIGGMAVLIIVGCGGGGTSVSLLKTDVKARLNRSAHSESVATSPASLVRVTVHEWLGFITCQNFRGLLVSNFGRSVRKKECLAFRIAVR